MKEQRRRRKTALAVLGYSSLLALVLICLKLLRQSYVVANIGLELYVGLASGAFLLIGLMLGRRLVQSRLADRNSLPAGPAEPLSTREAQILSKISSGSSNQEIADALSISLSTVKTHVSSIFAKLGVKRRTQAVDKARQLKLIA